MTSPLYKGHTTATVSNGSVSGDALSLAAPSPTPDATDHQVVGILMASSSADVGTTPSGWALLDNSTIQSDNAASGSSRVAFYEIAPDATLTQRQDVFAMTLIGARVWAAARGCYSLPVGSAGRVKAVAKLIEALGTGTQNHATPSVTTTAPDSLVVVFGGSDQYQSIGEQSWPSTGTFTQRVDLQGGNSIERQAITLADKVIATPAAVSETFTTLTADEVGMYALVLEGVGGAGSGPEPGRHLLAYS